MKIINNNECYVQGYDLNHLLLIDNKFPSNMYLEFSGSNGYITDLEKYYKIENQDFVDYLSKCGLIVDYTELIDLDVNELKSFAKRFKKFINDCISDSEENENIDLKDSYQRQAQLEYLIIQLKEMIKFKIDRSTSKFPDIPNPLEVPITDGIYCASKSINPDNILIYRLDSNNMDEMIDESFILKAYDSFKNEYEEDEIEEFRRLSEDLKYYIIGYKSKECVNSHNMLKRKNRRKRN